MLPRRFLALAVALFLSIPAVTPSSLAQDRGGGEQGAQDRSDGWPASTGGDESGGDRSVPVVENAPVEGQPQPDGAEGGGREVSGGGEVIAGGDIPEDTGPDDGGLVEEGADAPVKAKKKAKPKSRKAPKKRGRGAAALAAASMVSPLIPAAKLPVEPVRPVEPLPVVALSPIAPYNP